MHPITRERVIVDAPVPHDLEELMEAIGFAAALLRHRDDDDFNS
jgi:hypothetical protein